MAKETEYARYIRTGPLLALQKAPEELRLAREALLRNFVPGPSLYDDGSNGAH